MSSNNHNTHVELQSVALTPDDIESSVTDSAVPLQKAKFRWFTMVYSGMFILWCLTIVLSLIAMRGRGDGGFVTTVAQGLSTLLYLVPILKMLVAIVGIFLVPKWGYSSFRTFVHWRRTIITSCVIDVVFVVLWVILLVYATKSKEFFLILFVFGAAPFFSLALLVCTFVALVFNWKMLIETNSDEKKQVRIATAVLLVIAVIIAIIAGTQIQTKPVEAPYSMEYM